MREEQEGIELAVDLQVIDTNTCEPLANQYIEFWHTNATVSPKLRPIYYHSL